MFDGVDASVQPILVEPSQLGTWATRVRPYLDTMGAGSSGRYEGLDILTFIASGKMQLWVGLRGPDLLFVLVTDVQQYPRRRAMRLIGLVGVSPILWRRHVLPMIEDAAKRDFGCDLMEAFYPPRFGVLVPDYDMTHCFAEKSL